MPLPRKMDARVRMHIDSLLKQGQTLAGSGRAMDSGSDYRSFSTSVKNLAYRLLPATRYNEIQQEIQILEMRQLGRGATSGVFNILQALKTDYEAGILDDWSQQIEANVAYDFMEQAEQLLGGERHKHDHVPAAVLAGSVLENKLRRLCQQQDPPIETEKSNGDHKTLEPLINDLTTRNVFSKTQAKQLKVWADIRNHAAHGRFEEFERGQVEKMIPDIQEFLAKIE